MLNQIDQLKKELDSKKPLPPSAAEKLRDHLIVEWTYHSNALEGNTLTLNETKVILQDGITIQGKSAKECSEVINHKEAILFLMKLVQEKSPLSERDIKDMHNIVVTDRDNADQYRNGNVVIGATHIPPNFLQIADQMNQLIEWYHTESKDLDPVERASILHCEFVRIHPFDDGNGRTARLLLNLELMRYGYIPVIIKTDSRKEYYDALDEYVTNRNFKPIIEMVEKLEDEALKFYLCFTKEG